ncbi:MAG: peptidoglycan-binding protein [Ruminococcus sp.]|nr:peptidoglycan-binding protein [Ruminococcus sp.]
MKAIDISTWQSNIDFKKVKAAGITAVIIRAGYGREAAQKDNEFENHYRGAKAVGLKIGAYWYSYAMSVTDAEKEAKACLACIKGKSFDLPIYYDMEEDEQNKLSKGTLTQMACSFCDTIIAGGYRAGVYSNPDGFLRQLDYDTIRARYSVWLAHWASRHTIACDIWQYSSEGRVAGVSGDVDMNLIEDPAVIGGGSAQPAAVDTSSDKAASASLTLSYLARSGYQDSGSQVKTLQRLLNALSCRGGDNKALTVDGVFGANTDHAVRTFQKKQSIAVDGIVGSDTWKRLLGAE